MTELSVDAHAFAELRTVAAELASERRYRQKRATAMWWVQPPPMSLSTLPALRTSDGGPNSGYCWAVQRITVGPFGASTDLITAWKANNSTAAGLPQNALNSLYTAQVGAFVTWHPGGKGLIMMPDEALAFTGTITGTNPVASWDAIQFESWLLPEFVT